MLLRNKTSQHAYCEECKCWIRPWRDVEVGENTKFDEEKFEIVFEKPKEEIKINKKVK